MLMKNYLNEKYGLQPMTINEEINASDNIRAVRYSKMKIIDDCDAIMIEAANIKRRAKKFKEEDNTENAEYIQKWLAIIHLCRIKMDSASEYGFNTTK